MARTVADALAHARAALAAHPDAASDAEELVGRLTGLTRTQLTLERARALSADDGVRLDAWLGRRRAGEPVQYITGRAAFRQLDLAVTPAVLIPRPETEGLVEIALEFLRATAERWPQPRVLDLGTGSGAIALAIASEHPAAIVTATDASAAALAVARANARALGLEERITWLAGDWLEPLDPEQRFEAIVSNPPYLSGAERARIPGDVRDHEPAAALFSGDDGLDALREIVDEAPRHLVAGGLLALELAETRAAQVAAWLDGAHDWEGVAVREDLAGRPRYLVARRQRGPAIAPLQWPEER